MKNYTITIEIKANGKLDYGKRQYEINDMPDDTNEEIIFAGIRGVIKDIDKKKK